MVNRQACRGRLIIFLVALVVLARFQPGLAEDQDIEDIRKAAEEGNPEAQVELGAKHYLGMGAPQDYREALKWYLLAAEQGNAQAQFAVGRAYAQGEGTRQNYYLAAYWYRKAAEQGYVNGQVALADKYERGLGVAQDMKQAAHWYREAAQQGDAWAQVWLAEIYAKGRGILEDHVKAYAWLNLATAHGGPVVQVKAGHLKDTLRKQMTAEQLAEGQKLAAELWDRIQSGESDDPSDFQ